MQFKLQCNLLKGQDKIVLSGSIVLSGFHNWQSDLFTKERSENGPQGEATNLSWVPPPRKCSRAEGFTLGLLLSQRGRANNGLHGIEWLGQHLVSSQGQPT